MIKLLRKLLDWINPKEETSSIFYHRFGWILLAILIYIEGKILWKIGESIDSIHSLGKQIAIYGIYIVVIMIWGAMFLKVRLKSIQKQEKQLHLYLLVIFLEYFVSFSISFLCIKKAWYWCVLIPSFWFINRNLLIYGFDGMINKLIEKFKGKQSDQYDQ